MASRSSSSRGREKATGKGKGKISEPFCNPESGSSTQPQSSQTAKQTKSDYAFPIQTLLAFKEQGLTKLPNKTWASIADEDSNQDQLSLDQLIQKQKSDIIIVNPKLVQKAAPKSQYLQKTNSKFILNIEPKY